jgi:hypothetical protein
MWARSSTRDGTDWEKQTTSSSEQKGADRIDDFIDRQIGNINSSSAKGLPKDVLLHVSQFVSVQTASRWLIAASVPTAGVQSVLREQAKHQLEQAWLKHGIDAQKGFLETCWTHGARMELPDECVRDVLSASQHWTESKPEWTLCISPDLRVSLLGRIAKQHRELVCTISWKSPHQIRVSNHSSGHVFILKTSHQAWKTPVQTHDENTRAAWIYDGKRIYPSSSAMAM